MGIGLSWILISLILLKGCIDRDELVITESKTRFYEWEHAFKSLGELIDMGLELPVLSFDISPEEVKENQNLSNGWIYL